MSEENVKKGKTFTLKIVIPVLILCIVAGIWFVKNSQNESVNIESNDIEDVNPDFALHVTEELDLEQLKSYGVPIIIDFGADSCIPCKEMAPVLKKLNEDLRGKAIVKFVDVWKYQSLTEGYPISVIPTQVFFDKDGKPYTPTDPQAANMNMYAMKDTNEHIFTTHEGGMTEEMILAALKEMGLDD